MPSIPLSTCAMHRLVGRLASHPPDFYIDYAVVGAGVVGLAVAEQLSRSVLGSPRSVLVVESEPLLGTGASSRNSEVIHSGLYYPEDWYKTKLCIQGNQLLYKFLNHHKIPYNKCGKWIVARSEKEIEYLRSMEIRAKSLNVPLLRLSANEAFKIMPHVNLKEALVSPNTGIFDSHAYMQSLEGRIKSQNADIVYNTDILAIVREKLDTESQTGFRVFTKDSNFHVKTLINSTGLYSDKFLKDLIYDNMKYTIRTSNKKSELLINDNEKFDNQQDKVFNLYKNTRIYPCKGMYYRYFGKNIFIDRLVYPVPNHDLSGLGIHCTIDLSNGLRLGPSVLPANSVEDFDATPDKEELKVFANQLSQLLPKADVTKLDVDYAGLRAKLTPIGKGIPARDFAIESLHNVGLSFIHLAGIESPGLTASLAIAKLVANLLDLPMNNGDWEKT